jgi:hypothetical protein
MGRTEMGLKSSPKSQVSNSRITNCVLFRLSYSTVQQSTETNEQIPRTLLLTTALIRKAS